jgi:ureidoglycolate lyase
MMPSICQPAFETCAMPAATVPSDGAPPACDLPACDLPARDPSGPLRAIDLPLRHLTAAAFAPFGTLAEASEDGTPFGPGDAQLDLRRGTPRFYVMRLQHRAPAFTQITRHLAVTQCLASAGGKPWMLAVAPPADPDDAAAVPDPMAICAFLVPGHVAVVLHRSTWHAGPFFDEPTQDFFNLELADTNQVDHHDCRLDQRFGLQVRFTR